MKYCGTAPSDGACGKHRPQAMKDTTAVMALEGPDKFWVPTGKMAGSLQTS